MPPAEIIPSQCYYYVLYRNDLATTINSHISVLPPILMLEVITDPIYPEEMLRTQAWKEKDVKQPRKSLRVGWVPVSLPPDAILGNVERFDYDTSFGRLVEFKVPRFTAPKYQLLPPQKHIKQQLSGVTDVQLHK